MLEWLKSPNLLLVQVLSTILAHAVTIAICWAVVTRLGKRHKAESVIKATSPRGETIYWVGAAGPPADSGAGTDFCAVAANRVSVTPLQIDLTHYDEQAAVHSWLNSPLRGS